MANEMPVVARLPGSRSSDGNAMPTTLAGRSVRMNTMVARPKAANAGRPFLQTSPAVYIQANIMRQSCVACMKA